MLVSACSRADPFVLPCFIILTWLLLDSFKDISLRTAAAFWWIAMVLAMISVGMSLDQA